MEPNPQYLVPIVDDKEGGLTKAVREAVARVEAALSELIERIPSEARPAPPAAFRPQNMAVCWEGRYEF